MKRADVLRAVRFAGYHGDHAAAQRLYVESRVSWNAVADAYREGGDALKAGVPCGCDECKERNS